MTACLNVKYSELSICQDLSSQMFAKIYSGFKLLILSILFHFLYLPPLHFENREFFKTQRKQLKKKSLNSFKNLKSHLRCGYNYLVSKLFSMEIIFKVESSSWINIFSDVNQLYPKKKKVAVLGSLLLAALALILKRERATEHLSFKRKDVLMEHCIKILQRCSTLLIISEMQIKTTMRYHLIPVRMAAIKKSTNNKCWNGCGEKGTLLHCWWECKQIHPLWRTVWRFLKNLE